MSEVIQAIKLSKKYGTTHAVTDLNLSVKEGEIFGFLGLNGAGKTTTIRMLLGMVSPTSGKCFIQGKEIRAGSMDIWNQVGYMVETPYSYPELTVYENLEIIRRLRGLKDKSAVDWITHKLKLEAYRDKKAKHLSLGNAQRLGIAKAMIHKPKILILDEPTNGLDPAGIVEVRELLQDLAKNAGVSILVSSHKLDEISKIATNIAIIHAGKLIKEIDGTQLENEVQKSLVLNGRDRKGMAEALAQAGYKFAEIGGYGTLDCSVIHIQDENAVNEPDKVATMLVNASFPPTLLKVEREDLETYFLRIIKEAGGSQIE